jgi:hypothetical protein
MKRTVSYADVARERSAAFWKRASASSPLVALNASRESTLEKALEVIVRAAYETGYLNACSGQPSEAYGAIETADAIAARRAKRRKRNPQRNRGASV